jgi:L-iditol 2-dehydrogenase
LPPLVMGHEASGVVAEVGEAVSRVRPGDRVTMDSTISCGHCAACGRGDINLCTSRRILGVACDEFSQHGAFAEFVVVPQHVVYPLPPNVPFEHAALVEPVSVALHAVSRLQNLAGCTAVIVGSGMIGLLVIQALRMGGCKQVIAIDIEDSRLKLASDLGATATVNSRQSDPVDGVRKLTNGKGADVAMEVVGNAPALTTAIGCVCRGGQVGLVGNVSPEVPLPLQVVVSREITLVGSCASAGEYPQAIEAIADGSIRVAPLISAVAPLADGPAWFERLYAREPGLMKVVLCPSTSGFPA